MPLRRVALCFAAFVLFCAVFSGQSSAQFVVLRASSPTQSFATEALYTHRSATRKLSENLSFSYLQETQDTFDVSRGSGEFLYQGSIRNLTKQDLTINFVRAQNLPCGWQTLVCFGTRCLPADDSADAQVFPQDSAMDLIVHIDPTPDTIAHNVVVYLKLAANSGNGADTILIPIHAIYTPPADVRKYSWQFATFSKTFTGAKKHSITAQFENQQCDSGLYRFTIDPTVPANWTWSYCITGSQIVPDYCGMDRIKDYPFSEVQNIYENARKFTFSVTPPANYTQDSAIFTVHVQSMLSTRDTGTYRFAIIQSAPASAVTPDPALRAGIVVLNAWPNPIKVNARLNLELMTDKHGPAEAHIYDMAGVEKASFDLGDLALGTNRLVVTDVRLPSGDYIMRLEQDGAMSGPVRLNIIH